MEFQTRLKQELPWIHISSGNQGGFLDAPPVTISKPGSVKQLQYLVMFCRKTGLRLQTVSSKGNHDDRAMTSNTMIADMSDFNEVIGTDRRNRALMFEAGVTFDTLCETAKREGLRPMLPLCPKLGKSALTSYLDREPTIYPCFQQDMADPMLCMETITGEGKLFHTGAAAGVWDLMEHRKTGDEQEFSSNPGALDVMRIFQGARELFFQTTLDKTASFLPEAKSICEKYGRGWDNVLCYIQPQLCGRSCHMEFIFPTDETRLSASDEMLNLMADRMKAMGAVFSRPFRAFEPAAMSEGPLLPIIRKIRDIFDPDRVFASDNPIFADDLFIIKSIDKREE